MSKYVAVAAVVMSLVLVWLLWGQSVGTDSTTAATQPNGAAAGRPQSAAAPSPAAPAARPEAPAAATAPTAPRDQVALQARDSRRRAALAPFQARLLQTIDKCLPSAAGPRLPQRLVVRFERAGADATHEHFKIAAVEPVGAAPGQPPPQQSPAWACIASVVGQPLDIAAGPGQQESSFAELVAFPLPTSVGWAAPQPGMPQVP